MPNLKKKLKKQQKAVSFLLIIALANIIYFAQAESSDFWLISESEYNTLRPENTFIENLSYGSDNGPRINLIQPKITDKVSTPVNIYLRFEDSPTGSRPNMNSLIVKMKGLITLDITKRVEKFIDGTNLNIEEANIPKGKHNILIMIMDMDHNYSERLISFVIK